MYQLPSWINTYIMSFSFNILLIDYINLLLHRTFNSFYSLYSWNSTLIDLIKEIFLCLGKIHQPLVTLLNISNWKTEIITDHMKTKIWFNLNWNFLVLSEPDFHFTCFLTVLVFTSVKKKGKLIRVQFDICKTMINLRF